MTLPRLSLGLWRIPLVIADLFADGTPGVYYDLTDAARLWQDAAGATPVSEIGDPIGRAADDAPAGLAATQSTSGSRPSFQGTAGAAFDGAADNLLTSFTAGGGANFLVAAMTVPASLPAAGVCLGGAFGAANTRFFMSLSQLGAPLYGAGSALTGAASLDARGRPIVMGISVDAGVVTGFFAEDAVSTASYTGSPTTTYPIRVGALNSSGAASFPFLGTIRRLVAGRMAIDLATYRRIRRALLSGL